MQTLPYFLFADDRTAFNYILEYPNGYHQVKYMNQDMFPVNKLYQTYELSIGFKKDQLRKVICSSAIKVPVADRKYLCSILFGSWVEFNITTYQK